VHAPKPISAPAQQLRDAWTRFTARQERVGFWIGLLLLFVPVFVFLLFFRRYSWLARIGWSLWLGFIVFVKVTGLSEPIIQIHGPDTMPSVNTFGPGPEDLPIGSYVGKLLGAQYLDKYTLDGNTIVLTYERRDEYFDNPEILADLAISNGYSLMFRRDFQAVRFNVVHAGSPMSFTLRRPDFVAFFGITEAEASTYVDKDKLRSSPIYNVTKEGKANFIHKFAGL
jgi:hypothetical protein